MTYTINGKECTEFDINTRCAKLYLPCDYAVNKNDKSIDLTGVQTRLGAHGEPDERTIKYGSFDPCNNPQDTWPIIEKCWDELMELTEEYSAPNCWEDTIREHNCTKLVAACICLIEMNDND
tara:strand:- start:1309 stop:1674 length:366 start_codon:yes stop_codon:yes gene_type:complete